MQFPGGARTQPGSQHHKSVDHGKYGYRLPLNAVNDGCIFRLPVKPWRPRELKGQSARPWIVIAGAKKCASVRRVTGAFQPVPAWGEASGGAHGGHFQLWCALGCDIAGRVQSVGKTVKDFQPGDEVLGVTGFAGGGFAEYVCAPERKLVLKPVNSSFEEAAAIPIAGVTALQGLRDHGRIQPGQKVLVDGASGGVGTFAVQIAKSFGAEVTAVCSTGKMNTAWSIGADHVIDCTREDS